ncbi:MAG: type II toxin-antitoxin system RelE/ParE family toxin [Bacteroidota bacterium]
MFNVVIEKKAQKELSKISSPYYENIIEALRNLTYNPRPQGYKKLKGRTSYRIRVANYRIIYEIKDEVLVVLVITIAHRKNVYD